MPTLVVNPPAPQPRTLEDLPVGTLFQWVAGNPHAVGLRLKDGFVFFYDIGGLPDEGQYRYIDDHSPLTNGCYRYRYRQVVVLGHLSVTP